MKKFIVCFESEYLVRIPSWDNGEWTYSREKATVYDQDGANFFTEYYPQFTVVELFGLEKRE